MYPSVALSLCLIIQGLQYTMVTTILSIVIYKLLLVIRYIYPNVNPIPLVQKFQIH